MEEGKLTGILIILGLIIGALVPFILTTFLEGGASAVYEIFTS
jgi:hypothetical protein